MTASDKPAAEFDAYASDYAAGMDNPVKSLLGESADGFVAIKLAWMMRQFPELRGKGGGIRILDYGCGTATLLRLMAQTGLNAVLAGCDLSSGMLEEARERWPTQLPVPELQQQDGARTQFASGSMDIAVISAVLHHVPPADRSAVYAELHRVLRPGGTLLVFEHNPLNPVTRYVVAHTPIDQNAILLRAAEVRSALGPVEFDPPQVRYLMFLPPRLSVLAPVERALGWLPLGAQYAVTARRR